MVVFFKRKKEKRKEKEDKRVHVQPTISVELKEQIERLAYILDQPVSKMGVNLFIFGINEREVVDFVSSYFLNGSLIFENTLFIGHPDNHSLQDIPIQEPTDRISMRLDEDTHHDVDLYADFFGTSQSRAASFLLEMAIKHIGIIEVFLLHFNRRNHFDEVLIDEMKKLMRYIDRRNPYKAIWNDTFMTFIEGPKRKVRPLRKPMTPECVDTETYVWNLD